MKNLTSKQVTEIRESLLNCSYEQAVTKVNNLPEMWDEGCRLNYEVVKPDDFLNTIKNDVFTHTDRKGDVMTLETEHSLSYVYMNKDWYLIENRVY